MSRRRIARATLVQLVLFAVIAVACSVYVGVRVYGANPFASDYRIVVHMPDTGGLTPRSSVTYRGVTVGTVETTTIDPDRAGVTATLRLREGTRIPASSKAVVTMSSPIDLTQLDLRPDADRPPYLGDGGVIASAARPLPLETLLTHFLDVANSLNPEDLTVLGRELTVAFSSGSTEELTRLADAASTLVAQLDQAQPALTNVTGNLRALLGSTGGTGLARTAAQLRAVTGELRGQLPAIENVLGSAPDLADEIVPLLQQARPSLSTMLANLVTTSQIVVDRVPALNELLVAAPSTLGKLASIEWDGTAHFYLVATQGPACYYGTQRRPATDTGDRAPQQGWSCPGNQPDSQQRGAANTPRPGGATVTTYDPATGTGTAPDGSPVRLGTSGGQAQVLGPRSWYALYLQGIQ